MDVKKLAKALLYPPIAVMFVLVPVSVVALVYSMVVLGTESIPAILSYVLSAYTLTVWCVRAPDVVKAFKWFRANNGLMIRWRNDAKFRINVSLYATLGLNVAYALLQLGLGYWHKTFWFYSLAGYYATLAVMRYYLVRYTKRHDPGEKMLDELYKYRACGVIFLVMNLALALVIFFMVYWNRTFVHHEITTIAMAAYTFTALTLAIVNMVKYRRYNSPVYSATKITSLASACVSVLTLESTMLTTFGNGTLSLLERKILLATSGGAISAFIIVMAILMIVKGPKEIKLLKTAKERNDGTKRDI